MLPLQSYPLQLAVLSSGSKGNCTWVGDHRNGVLVDCGPSSKRIFELMESVGLGEAPIDAVLITHEHSDHVGAARILHNKLKKRTGRSVPFFMTKGTLDGCKEQCIPANVQLVTAGEPFRHGPFTSEAFSIPHDVRDPVAYRIERGPCAAAVLTDLGRPTALVAEKIREVDLLVLETNHDEQMLFEGPYPWELKQRIRSNHGHLSNRQSARLLSMAITPRLKHVVLAHLSEENNTPELAREAIQQVVGDQPVTISVGKQLCAMGPYEVRAAMNHA
ncbi:MAG: MBL fold metallo-hydrolase [Myxococcota bacterium]|nr:MBL fold metallo-hydrolase [Myxococcota bacterium]